MLQHSAAHLESVPNADAVTQSFESCHAFALHSPHSKLLYQGFNTAIGFWTPWSRAYTAVSCSVSMSAWKPQWDYVRYLWSRTLQQMETKLVWCRHVR